MMDQGAPGVAGHPGAGGQHPRVHRSRKPPPELPRDPPGGLPSGGSFVSFVASGSRDPVTAEPGRPCPGLSSLRPGRLGEHLPWSPGGVGIGVEKMQAEQVCVTQMDFFPPRNGVTHMCHLDTCFPCELPALEIFPHVR